MRKTFATSQRQGCRWMRTWLKMAAMFSGWSLEWNYQWTSSTSHPHSLREKARRDRPWPQLLWWPSCCTSIGANVGVQSSVNVTIDKSGNRTVCTLFLLINHSFPTLKTWSQPDEDNESLFFGFLVSFFFSFLFFLFILFVWLSLHFYLLRVISILGCLPHS